MVLKYSFQFSSNNNTLINFINKFFKEENLEYLITKEDEKIEVYIDEEEEVLVEVSEKLGTSLPMSIFFKDYTLEVVPHMPQNSTNYIGNEFKLQLPFCLNCLANVENIESQNYYNPFSKCEVCGTTCDVENVNYDNQEYTQYKELFENLALDISLGKKVKIKTLSGDFVFYKNEKPKNNENILCTDINALSSFCIASKEETVALVSLEKPRLKLKINEQYKIIKAIDTEEVYVRYSNDLILYLLSKELTKLNVSFISYSNDIDFDKELSFDKEITPLDISTICLSEGRTLVLESTSYDKKLDTIYSKIEQKQKAQFMVLLEENDLYEKSILNFFSSKTEADNITLYAQKIGGMIDIVNLSTPSSVQDIFDEISSDEIGARLVENYKNKYPEIYEKAINFDTSTIKTQSIFALWDLASAVLGIDSIYESANACKLDKGPRVDYKIFDSDKIFNKQFKLAKFIQSGISFKLAGVDDNTLALGYMESFAYFLANVADEVNSEFELDGISLCGDMLSSEVFYKLLKKAITNNFKIYYNRDFPIQK